MELKAMLQAAGYEAWCSSVICETPTSPTNGVLNDLFGQDGMPYTSPSVETSKLALTRLKSTDSLTGLRFFTPTDIFICFKISLTLKLFMLVAAVFAMLPL